MLTLAAAIFAKILILAFALGPILRDEILRSREATAAVFLLDMAAPDRSRPTSVRAGIGFVPLLARLFGLFDMLWLGLGVSSAWKLAQS